MSSYHTLEDNPTTNSILLSKDSGRISAVWLVFCHIFASFVLLAAIGTIIAGALTMVYAESNRRMAWAGVVVFILSSLAAGICAVISVVHVTHKSVKIWTGVHVGLFLVMVIGVVLVAATSGAIEYTIFFGTGGVSLFFQLAFCCTYGPLISVKNLQKPPACAC